MSGCQATAALFPAVINPLIHQAARPGAGASTSLFLGKIIVTFGDTITLLFSKDKLGCSFHQRDLLIHYSLHGANEKAIIN